MIPLYLKIIMTVALSIISVVLYLALRGQSRRDCMIAMLLSTVGDTFMTNLWGIGDFSTYIGAAFFIAAHIVYAGCFVKKCREEGIMYFNRGFFAGLAVMVITAAGLGILAFTVPENPSGLMFVLILLYIAFIGYNLCSNFAYSFAIKGTYLILPLAIFVFYVTDIFIFLDMLNIYSDLMQYVWYAYPVAQLALVLFNDSFKRVEE